MVGGGDGDRVDILVLEDPAHIGLELGPFAGLLKDSGGRGFRAAAVDVAHAAPEMHAARELAQVSPCTRFFITVATESGDDCTVFRLFIGAHEEVD